MNEQRAKIKKLLQMMLPRLKKFYKCMNKGQKFTHISIKNARLY